MCVYQWTNREYNGNLFYNLLIGRSHGDRIMKSLLSLIWSSGWHFGRSRVPGPDGQHQHHHQHHRCRSDCMVYVIIINPSKRLPRIYSKYISLYSPRLAVCKEPSHCDDDVDVAGDEVPVKHKKAQRMCAQHSS